MPTPADALRIRKLWQHLRIAAPEPVVRTHFPRCSHIAVDRKQHDLLPAGRDAADAWLAEISHFPRKEDDFDLPAGAPTAVCQSAGFPG
jgi:hypothetical protein